MKGQPIPAEARRHLRQAITINARLRTEEERHRARMAELMVARRSSWLLASRAGARYEDIQAECQVSDGLVCREIKRARTEATGDLGARLRRTAATAARP